MSLAVASPSRRIFNIISSPVAIGMIGTILGIGAGYALGLGAPVTLATAPLVGLCAGVVSVLRHNGKQGLSAEIAGDAATGQNLKNEDESLIIEITAEKLEMEQNDKLPYNDPDNFLKVSKRIEDYIKMRLKKYNRHDWNNFYTNELVKNSINAFWASEKYQRRESLIIKIKVAQKGNIISIKIKDNAIGFPHLKKREAHVFEPEKRGILFRKWKTKRMGGDGLGVDYFHGYALRNFGKGTLLFIKNRKKDGCTLEVKVPLLK